MGAEAPTLFYGATVHTVDALRPRAEWFTVLGRRFQHVGTGPPPPLPKRVDLSGCTVVPGFVDAHIHFFQTGIDALHIDLSGVRTVREVQERLRDGAPRGRRTWVFANRFEEESLEDAPLLTRQHLDSVFKDRPIWVNRIDYHSAVVNSLALRRLDIPSGTRGVLHDEDGTPTGVLRAGAYIHAKGRVSRQYSVETTERAVRAAVDACLPRGITAVHALEGGEVFGHEGVHAVLSKMPTIPVDVTLFLQEKDILLTSTLGFGHLGGCILVDGSIGSYTAALDAPYEGQPGMAGLLYENQRSLGTFVTKAHRAGIQLAFHAIGPRAIDVVLNAYEKALKQAPRFDHRHRIEHFELATDEQIARAADLGLVLSMQPAFEHYWGGPSGMYASRLGARWKRTNRLRTILDAGIVVAGGSDANVTPPDPLLGMHAAVNHPNPDERVRPVEALRMFTLDAAHAGFNEKRHGSIAAGKEASFVVLREDPLEVAAERIKDITVLSTWSRGRPAWRG